MGCAVAIYILRHELGLRLANQARETIRILQRDADVMRGAFNG